MSKKSTEIDIQLELKDRLAFVVLIQNTLENIEAAYSKPDFDYKVVQNITEGLFHRIPDFWIDKQYVEDLKKCIVDVVLDVRPRFCGIRLDEATCKEYGVATFVTVKRTDYNLLQKAIINLLDRRGMLVRKDKIERSTGVNLEEVEDQIDQDIEVDSQT